MGETTIPHALYRSGLRPADAGVVRTPTLQKDNDVLGGEWLGVDQIETETSHGLRVNGAQVQDIDSMGRELDELGLARCPTEQAQAWAICFKGSGAEYFRIWAVNTLLTLLTLGLYHPWARARKLRYLFTHTEVAGHPLDFHGEPRNMLRGFLLSGVLFLTYVCAGQWTPWAGSVAVLAVAGTWPALYLAAMQFRLAHTSWHGLPFGFAGDMAGAYQALAAPLLISGLALIAMAWGVVDGDPDSFWGWAAGVLWLVFAIGLPFFYWQLRDYQHANLRLGPLQTQWKATPSMIYNLMLRAAVFWLVALALVTAVVTLAVLGVGGSYGALLQDPMGNVGLGLFVVVVLWLAAALIRAYVAAHLQNLVWTKTGNRYVRFRSQVAVGRFVRLQLVNQLLIMGTLGLYWPWAVIATRRMRLQAVTVVSRVVPEDLVASIQTRQGGAAAEVGAEMLGLDLGW